MVARTLKTELDTKKSQRTLLNTSVDNKFGFTSHMK